jgi:flagellar biosynthetic protein FliO
VHIHYLSLIALAVLALSSQASGQADLPIGPNDPNSRTESISLGNPDANAAGQPSSSAGMPDLFFRMMLSILLVIGLGGVALFLSKKVLPKVTRGSAKEIRVVETIYLGPRKALHLVEVGQHRLLIGSTNESITPLATVSDAWLDTPKSSADDMVNL